MTSVKAAAMRIENVTAKEQLQRVEQLAKAIWHEHYTPIIGQEQVAYMLENFQSSAFMQQQLEEGFLYYLLTDEGDDIGYMAVQPREETFFMSKFYLHSDHRRKGHGKTALAFLSRLAADKGVTTITLTVNRHNTLALRAYEKLGFKNVGTIVQEIGGGFVMDDYRMEKNVTES